MHAETCNYKNYYSTCYTKKNCHSQQVPNIKPTYINIRFPLLDEMPPKNHSAAHQKTGRPKRRGKSTGELLPGRKQRGLGWSVRGGQNRTNEEEEQNCPRQGSQRANSTPLTPASTASQIQWSSNPNKIAMKSRDNARLIRQMCEMKGDTQDRSVGCLRIITSSVASARWCKTVAPHGRYALVWRSSLGWPTCNATNAILIVFLLSNLHLWYISSRCTQNIFIANRHF